MPARVSLKVTEGELKGKEYVYDERTTCILGRAPDCSPRIPDDKAHRAISRHHCLLDINPPDIRVRDFGSLNGTYVNGKKIGQRPKGQTAEEAAQVRLPEYDLNHGDQVQLAKTVFRVGVSVPVVCVHCFREIPNDQKRPSETASGIYQCVACREKAQKAGVQKPRRRPPSTCTMCGRDVSSEVTGNRQGEFICVACKADPFEILKGILKLANAGDKELLPIQGYVVKRELGRGGMGAAFLARHEKTGERVALKVMLPRVPASEHAKQSFLREMENTKLLKHRNIVQFKAGGCGNGTFFLAVEYCDRGTLAKLMQSHGGKLAIDDATGIVLQALDGLEYAHNAEIPYIKLIDGSIGRGRGLVHRDLKPSNIFLTGSGSGRIAKIGDYGLAKAFDMAGLSGCTRTGLAAGTPVFLPRQQVGNFKYAKPEVDVWAMAATLYYMLTGTVPRDFPKGRDPWQVVLQSKPVPIRQRDASIPRRLAEVIDQALIDEPEIGFKTALEFKLQLEHALR